MHKQAQKITKKMKLIFIFSFLTTILIVVMLINFDETLSLLKTSLVANNYAMVSDDRMDLMKTSGCVYDGLLTPRYNQQFNVSVEMLKRSQCRYIHRAVETWNIPPDFNEIKKRINIIKNSTGKSFVYSLFIAESIDITKGYYDPIKKRNFNFSAMCSPGTFGAWGKNTCKPSIQKKEYREYLSSIMKRAVDVGIEDFTFGQVYYQDQNWKKSSRLIRSIIADVKKYAVVKKKEISIGGQTNTMDNEKYLRSFDYITGGIGQNSNGEIQKEGPCWDYYYRRDGYCWAMLWDKKYKNIANNILVYLDWNNSNTDDIHRFTRMSKVSRKNFFGTAYDFFLQQDVGFLSPLGVVLGNVGSGCYGPTREFYSASNRYSCKDEDAINDVLNGKTPLSNASQIVSVDVAGQMESGKIYPVKIKIKNTSFRNWTKNDGFKLGSRAPQDNFIWGINRIELSSDDRISHDEIKEFSFNVTAPATPGTYDFNWGMVEEKVEWFGNVVDNVAINITSKATDTFERDNINNDVNEKNSLLTQLVEGPKDEEAPVVLENNENQSDNFLTILKNKFKSLTKNRSN